MHQITGLTGATGYVGNALLRRLLDDGAHVRALVRADSATQLSPHARLQVVTGDLLDEDSIERFVSGCDVIYHVAALARVWHADPSLFQKLNADATKTLLDYAVKSGVKKVVFTSSGATMTPTNDGRQTNEEDVRNIQWFNLYEVTKNQAEQYCKKVSETTALDVVVVNPTRVFGYGQETDSNAVSRLISGYIDGSWRFIPGDGESLGNYAYLPDVVHGHVMAMEKGRGGERYILGGDNLTFNALFEAIEKYTGIKRRMIRVPAPVMYVTAAAMEQVATLGGPPPAITRNWVKKFRYHWAFSTEKAERELSWRLTPFHDAIQQTISDILTAKNGGSLNQLTNETT